MQHAAFRIHPYHHEVIGDMADLHTMTRDDLYNHYRRFYVPNNAVMAVSGDFDTNTMLARIKKLFETIPAGSEPARLARQFSAVHAG
jgi:zinc protease